MKLTINVLGVEVASIRLDMEPTAVQTVEQVVEPRLGKLIGRISTAWVATGMRR